MSLQELIGELQTIAMAYPATTPVHIVVESHSFSATVDLVRVESSEDVIVALSAQ